jgi:AraC-like DNA-binding protein/tetratricopeptide (TPR) repeat protein
MEQEQSMQEQYLALFRQIIEDNLDNASFSVADLARKAGLSRSMLHRKLISLTGKSATDLITEIRLKKAFELLEKNAGTVSEIAYMVGYSSPSYFNKVFKKTYKVSPGEVRRKGRGNFPHLRVVNEHGIPVSAGPKRSGIKVFGTSNTSMIIIVTLGTLALILAVVDRVSSILSIPDWVVDAVLYIWIAALFINYTVSWINKIFRPAGMQKASIGEESSREQKRTTSIFWKMASYVSFAVILTMLGILLYPKIFRPNKLSELRNEEGVITLAILPFENLTGDSSIDYWQEGISVYLINKLGSAPMLAVLSTEAIADVLAVGKQDRAGSLSDDMARLTAGRVDASAYITGSLLGKENDATIMLNLFNTENGELIWSSSVGGNLGSDYRKVLDHLSDITRNYLEIRILEGIVEPEMSNAFPNSAEAYRYYIDGLNAFMNIDYESAIEYLNTSYHIDSTFTFAAFYLAFAHNMSNPVDENCVRWARRAYELRSLLPTVYRPWIENFYTMYVTKDFNDLRSTSDRMYEAAIENRFFWWDLGSIYAYWLRDYPKAISAYQRVEALNHKWGDTWKFDDYYKFYALDLVRADQPEEAIRIANMGLQVNPSNMWLVMAKGAAYIMLGDSINAPMQKQEIQKMMQENNSSEARAIHWIASMHWMAKDTLGALPYFRKAFEMDTGRRNSLAMVLRCQLRTNRNLEECQELIEYGIQTHPGRNLQFFWLKGLYFHKVGKHQEALEILREVEKQWGMYDFQLDKDIQEVERTLALQSGS